MIDEAYTHSENTRNIQWKWTNEEMKTYPTRQRV